MALMHVHVHYRVKYNTLYEIQSDIMLQNAIKCNKSQNNYHTPTVWLFMLLFRLWVNGNTKFYATSTEKSDKEIYMKMRVHLPVSYSIRE